MLARGLLRFAVPAVVIGVLAASCFVEGFVRVEQAPPTGGSSAAGGGGTGGGTGGGAPTCQHATWPPPPDSSDIGADTEDFVVAVRTLDFGESDLSAGPTVGYDLDNRCTCQGEGASCNEPAWADADHCDGPAGRDNATAQLFADLTLFESSISSESNSAGAERGDFSLLIRVRNYNGQANDDRVTLSIYPSPGLDEDPCLPSDTPSWDGTDRWPVSAEALNGYEPSTGGGGGAGGAAGAGGAYCGGGGAGASGLDVDDARYSDDNAYVTDWVVVANLPEAGMLMAGSGRVTPLRITAGFIAARIEPASVGGWQLREGLFTGRWRLADLFEMVGFLESSGEKICTDHPVYSAIKALICQYPDIAASLTGPTTPCDALSFAVGLTADPARLGRIWVTSPDTSTCPPGTDPRNDYCGT